MKKQSEWEKEFYIIWCNACGWNSKDSHEKMIPVNRYIRKLLKEAIDEAFEEGEASWGYLDMIEPPDKDKRSFNEGLKNRLYKKFNLQDGRNNFIF